MSATETEAVFTDEELNDEYIAVAFSNGFSKGTANVTPHDMQKLRPLLNHYAKESHPFTACVRDNRKRFGPRTEAICAVIKDLIYHSTDWRKGRQGGKAHLSADEVKDFILHELPDAFLEWLHEVTEEEMQQFILDSQESHDEELTLSDDALLTSMFFQAGEQPEDGTDGVIWKTILREGTWKYSPGAGQTPVRKPITVNKTGKSDPENMVISMSELMRNFKNEAVEHVQIPTGHKAGVLENTGFAKDLKLVKDGEGKWELKAALDFTEPSVKEKTLNGTIANTSAGILFNYIRKEDGKKFGAVLDHVALTNRPWLNGLQPFGAQMAEDDAEVEVALFSEEGIDLDDRSEKDDDHRGGEDMPEKEKENEETKPETDGFLQKLGLSEDEVQARLSRYEELEAESKKNRVETKVREWEGEKKSPAVIKEARRILLADEGTVVLHLAQDGGKSEDLTASEIVSRLVAASPKIELDESKVNDKDDSEGGEPEKDAEKENEAANLSHAEKALASSLFLEGEAQSEEEAISMAKKKLGSDAENGK